MAVFPTGFCGQCPMCLCGPAAVLPDRADAVRRLRRTHGHHRELGLPLSGFRQPGRGRAGRADCLRAQGDAHGPPDEGPDRCWSWARARWAWLRSTGRGTWGQGAIVVATRSARGTRSRCAIGADAAVRSVSDEDPRRSPARCAEPPDIVVECIGKPGVLHMAAQKVRLGGTVLSLGMCVRRIPCCPPSTPSTT